MLTSQRCAEVIYLNGSANMPRSPQKWAQRAPEGCHGIVRTFSDPNFGSEKVGKNPFVARARATFSSKLPFHFHTSFWTSFWVPFGPLLAPLWLPKGLPDSPKRLQMHPKCSKMEDQNGSKSKKPHFQKIHIFPTFFNDFGCF